MAEAVAKPILFSYFRSSCSWRVRIALALHGIEYEYRAVNLIKDGGEQHSEDFKTLNPMGQIPALTIDGHTLTQSIAILEYLEDTRPVCLLPKDPVTRAKVRAITETIASGIQPMQNLSVLQKLGDDRKMEWGKFWIDKGFQALEPMLAATAGKFCVGDELSLADVCLVPQVFNANRFSVDMSKFPIISRLNDELSALDTFKAAAPAAQPDCPEDLKNK